MPRIRLVGPQSLDVVSAGRSEIAEGPLWDPARNSLWFFDVLRGLLHRLPADGGDSEVFRLGEVASSAALRADGSLLVCMGYGFATFTPESGLIQPALGIEPHEPGMRMNDGKADPRGRFWAGTMQVQAEPARGSLYSLSADWVIGKHFSGCTISNGLGWSPASDLFYYIDTPTRRIDCYAFDLASGTLGERRTLIDLSDAPGRPDGMAVDSAGRLWVAMAEGGRVLSIDPDGVIAGEIRLPVSLVTSCAFGGHGLDQLFITSGYLGLSEAERASQPLAGMVFSARMPGVCGLPIGVFRG
jgi:sugar lactone lactonase YvrE